MNIKIFKKTDFTLLMITKFISVLGSQMQSFAMALYVLQITDSTIEFASVLVINAIPQIILAPFVESLVARFDKKKTIILLNFLSTILVGGFAIIGCFNGMLDLIYIYLLNFSLSLISIVYSSSLITIKPLLLEKEELIDGNSLESFVLTISNILAPLLGALLLGWFDIFAIFYINSISFAVAAIIEFFIKVPKCENETELNTNDFKKDLVEGFEYVKNMDMLFIIISFVVLINFVNSSLFSIGVIFISKKILLASDIKYSIVEIFLLLSMLTSSLTIKLINKKFQTKKIIIRSLYLIGGLIFTLSIIISKFTPDKFLQNNFSYIIIIILFSLIAYFVQNLIILLTLNFQEVVHVKMMERTETVMNTLMMVATPISLALFGALTDIFNMSSALIIYASVIFIIVFLLKENFNSEEVIYN